MQREREIPFYESKRGWLGAIPTPFSVKTALFLHKFYASKWFQQQPRTARLMLRRFSPARFYVLRRDEDEKPVRVVGYNVYDAPCCSGKAMCQEHREWSEVQDEGTVAFKLRCYTIVNQKIVEIEGDVHPREIKEVCGWNAAQLKLIKECRHTGSEQAFCEHLGFTHFEKNV